MLFKLAGGLGTHTQRQGGLPDGGAVEVGGLKHHHGGILPDFGIQAAHNARKAYGLCLVGNHQHTGCQNPLGALQRGHGLAFLRLPDNNLAGGNIAVVKGVHGLAVLQHDVVGDVHNVVDGPHTVGPETGAHPLGAGADFHVGNHPGGVAVTQLLGGHLYIQMLKDGACIGAPDHRLVVFHGLAEGRRGLPGQSDDGIAVGPVVGDFKIHHGIVVADDGVDVIAGLTGIGLQNPDAVGIHAGQVVLGQAQLREGAQHAVGHFPSELALGDMHTAGQIGIVQCRGHQISLVDVLGAGDDLYRFFPTHVHLTDEHMVRVGMAHHGQNPAYHHVPDFRVHPLPGFHLLAENGEGLYKFLIGNLAQVHEFFIDPFSVQFHFLCLLRTGSGTERRCRRSDADR